MHWHVGLFGKKIPKNYHEQACLCLILWANLKKFPLQTKYRRELLSNREKPFRAPDNKQRLF